MTLQHPINPFEISGYKFGDNTPYGIHYGVDIKTIYPDTPDGIRPVYAALDGEISSHEHHPIWGLYMTIRHNKGNDMTYYGHLNDFAKWSDVRSIPYRIGQHVSAGDKIAYSGKTGQAATAPHLHFEYHINNVPVNPLDYFENMPQLLQLIKRQNDEDVYAIIKNKRWQIGDNATAQFWNGTLWDLSNLKFVDDSTFANFPKGGVILTTQGL